MESGKGSKTWKMMQLAYAFQRLEIKGRVVVGIEPFALYFIETGNHLVNTSLPTETRVGVFN
jgi:hypothetical protein